MKINKIFHSLYFMVMFLPCFIIPIFAININQKSVEPISIEVQEKMSVDFNQLRNTWYNNQPSLVTLNDDISATINGTTSGRLHLLSTSNVDLKANHKYLVNGIDTLTLHTANWSFDCAGNKIVSASQTYTTQLHLETMSARTFDNLVIYVMVYDLTQMYGVGNEPTYNEFINEFSNNYYPYTNSQKMLVEKPTPTTYDDTDIGSQFLYSLYKPINDYFNFNNLFNMNDVWNWIQLNLFQGTAPLPVFMIWNIIIYEFFVDLLFLLYAVFMFIIDWSTGLIDKFLGRSRT